MRNKLLIALAAIVVAVAGWMGAYHLWGSPTRIAFVNYPEYILAPLLDFDTGKSIEVDAVEWQDATPVDILKEYDAIFFFGMGLKFNESQQAGVSELMKEIPVYVTASTRQETALSSLTDEQYQMISGYLGEGGKENFRRLLNYVRYELDGKRLFAHAPEPPEKVPRYRFFHAGERGFETLKQYMDYYRGLPTYREDNPWVLLFSGNGGGALEILVEALENRGVNVVAANGMFGAAEMIREVDPDAVVYSPHGRLPGNEPDEIVNLLKEKNIPLFCPIKAGQLYEEFLKDQRGMTGGMLSQSITMPELDGGVAPFVLSALYENERGLQEFRVIPGRAERYAELIRKTLELQRKPNSEKKIAIIYYKGAGKSELAAGALEVGDSLLNTLRTLRDAGYNTGELPENTDELLQQIQDNAAVFGTYAKGAMADFLSRAKVELISPEEYITWVRKAMPADLYAEVEKASGPAPGNYFNTVKDGKPYLALGMLKFGNVVILPQTLPGIGDDDNAVIHGVKQAPPHSYLATYLWIRYGFEADAMMHFGTHGSLEFTPWKDVALSDYDWPDVLVGEMPHYYLYVINNIGEALLAKRRSYATMVSHLTPPFMSSDLYGPLEELDDKIHDWENAEDPLLKAEYVKTIIKLIKQEKFDEELRFSPDFAEGKLTEEDIVLLHNHLHEIDTSKVNRGLYVIARPYTAAEADETAVLMTVDHLASDRFDADVKSGKVSRDLRKNQLEFDKLYTEPARADLIAALSAPASTESQDTDIVLAARQALLDSTQAELDGILNGFNGGYLAPSPGGDPVGNPDTVPTGRNLYGIDPERTPTRESYAVGCTLGEELIRSKLETTGNYPKKVAFTLWGGEFIRTQGTNIGEIFFLLGVEPIWDSRGKVVDVRLIPQEELKRPRIDVVVQTSGQFRGAGSSRLVLIDKAIRLAAADPADEWDNYVKEGSDAAVRVMLEKGLSPREARELANVRIFGGVNGNFGTGITGMVEAGDKWEDSSVIAERYLNNMGAIYTGEKWGEFVPGVFEAALQNTDTVVHSRSSNSYGPLSLDHIYEFMGGINLTIKNVTGNEPDAYFNDLRTPGRAKVQDAAQAVMVEARTSLLNPKYIREMMEEGPTAAGSFAEAFRNTYGWEVMKPDLVKDHLWEEYKRVYIDDELELGMREYFEEKNPYALQEMTAVMLETVRKGMWNADAETVKELAELHAELVEEFGAGCTGFVCNNAKLNELIRENISAAELKEKYSQAIASIRNAPAEEAVEKSEEVKGMKLKEEKIEEEPTITDLLKNNRNALLLIGGLIVLALTAFIAGSIRRKRMSD